MRSAVGLRRRRLPDVAVAPTVSEAVADGARRLEMAGVATPQLDASVLLAFVLGVGRERLVVDGRSRLQADTLVRYRQLIARRAAREPVAYITGVREFRLI